jgi:anti-sigma B factor antagonist
MTVTISAKEAGATRIAIEGELDTVTVGDLRAQLDKLVAKEPKRVEVDLSALRMLDSSGVGALVSLYKRVRGYGGEVVMVGLRDQPLAIFRLLRLDRVMIGTELAASAGGAQKQSSSNH